MAQQSIKRVAQTIFDLTVYSGNWDNIVTILQNNPNYIRRLGNMVSPYVPYTLFDIALIVGHQNGIALLTEYRSNRLCTNFDAVCTIARGNNLNYLRWLISNNYLSVHFGYRLPLTAAAPNPRYLTDIIRVSNPGLANAIDNEFGLPIRQRYLNQPTYQNPFTLFHGQNNSIAHSTNNNSTESNRPNN